MGGMRDLAVLFLHLLATVGRLAGPGGARAVVAESVLIKQQLLILNRSPQRSPNLRLADRLVAGVCTLLMRPRRLVRSAIVLKPSTLLRLHRALIGRKYRRLFSSTVPTKPGRKGPIQEVIAAVVDMKQRNPTCVLSTDRATDRLGFRDSHEQGCGATHSRRPVSAEARRGGAVGARGPRARDGQFVERRSVSMRIGHPACTLGARGDGPIHAAHRGLRRTARRRGWRGAVSNVQPS